MVGFSIVLLVFLGVDSKKTWGIRQMQIVCLSAIFFTYQDDISWGDGDSSGGRQITHTGGIKQCKRMVIWMDLPLYIQTPLVWRYLDPQKIYPKKTKPEHVIGRCSGALQKCSVWVGFVFHDPWIHPTQTKTPTHFFSTLCMNHPGRENSQPKVIRSATNVELNPSFIAKGLVLEGFSSAKMEDIHRFQVDEVQTCHFWNPWKGSASYQTVFNRWFIFLK